MKNILFKPHHFWVVTLLVFVQTSCKDDFLVEKPVSTLTTDSYYKTEAGFEDLVKSCYPLLRNIHQNRVLVLNGTDVFSSQADWNPAANGTIGQPNVFDVYDARFNSGLGELQSLWQQLYAEIARTNTVISRAAAITTMAADLKDTRVSEAKFLRALSLFYAVQQWGDIPMPLTEITSPGKDFPRVPSATVYKQIITDLTAVSYTHLDVYKRQLYSLYQSRKASAKAQETEA